MTRKICSIALAVSFVAMASSGLIMLTGDMTLQAKMHPVHNVFGLIMILAGAGHFVLNFKPLKRYLTKKSLLALALTLVALLAVAYVAAANKTVPPEIQQKFQEIGALTTAAH